jgi:hypothetical protein
MALSLETGVKPYTMSDFGKSFEFVGEWDSKAKGVHTKFYVGAYGFSNPFSANMFAYLFRQYDGNTAKSVVKLFEQDLKKSSASKFMGMIEIDWKGIFEKGMKGAVDWQGTVTNLAVAAGGWAVTQYRLGNVLADQNPNSAKQDSEQYVAYAIAYWGKNPTKGPAYRMLRY